LGQPISLRLGGNPSLKESCKIGSRDELVRALRLAAELEHGLLCQYLFAAFTIRRTDADFDSSPDRRVLQIAQRWESTLLLVARQEMEHLALVCNLLNAVAGDLNFQRPNFPQPAKRYPLHIPFRLDPFGVPALRRFVWAERPNGIFPSFAPDGYCESYPRPAAARRLESLEVPESDYETVLGLYLAILDAFQALDPAEVFIGSPDRQVDGSQLFNYRVTVEPVTNREDAAAAIGLIVEQGEGIGMNPLDPDGSHFQMFLQILGDFEEAKRNDPGFSPALDVVENPVLDQDPGAGIGTIVTHKPSRAGMELFNEAYNLMLMMLRSWFGHFSFSQNYPRQAAEFYAAFFPLMTMVLRPLGEILTRMPAGVDGKKAGPSFEISKKDRDQIPDRKWYLRKLRELEERCSEFLEYVPDPFRNRVTFICQNIHATGLHFADLWNEVEKPTRVSHFPV
jgi:hypothetical protein